MAKVEEKSPVEPPPTPGVRAPSIVEQPGHALVAWWFIFAAPFVISAATALAGRRSDLAALGVIFLSLAAYVIVFGLLFVPFTSEWRILAFVAGAIVVAALATGALYVIQQLPVESGAVPVESAASADARAFLALGARVL